MGNKTSKLTMQKDRARFSAHFSIKIKSVDLDKILWKFEASGRFWLIWAYKLGQKLGRLWPIWALKS